MKCKHDLSKQRYRYYLPFPKFRLKGETECNPLLDMPIDDINISVRLKNCLKFANCVTVKDILKYTKKDLLWMRNFGARSINELENFLQKNNLKFKHP